MKCASQLDTSHLLRPFQHTHNISPGIFDDGSVVFFMTLRKMSYCGFCNILMVVYQQNRC